GKPGHFAKDCRSKRQANQAEAKPKATPRQTGAARGDIEDQQLQEPSMSLNAYRHHHQMSAIQLRNSKNSESRVKKKNPMRNCWKYTLPLRKAKRKPKSQRVPQTTLSISGQKTPHGGDM